jgi:hypothetical protein
MTPPKAIRTAGQAALDELLRELATDKGVHIESAAVALGALAGFGCQVCVTLEIKDTGSFHGFSVFEVEGSNGESYLYGDAINRPLLESPDSIWTLLSGAARELGSTVPDVEELFGYVAQTVGTDRFGVPRYAPETWSEPPRSFVMLWGKFSWIFRDTVPSPTDWYLVYGVALQRLLTMVAGQFDLEPLVRIAMESAIAMAKLIQA